MDFPVTKTDAEWLEELGPERFEILRQAGTEAPFTGSLLNVNANGTYTCGGCQAVLFNAGQKFDSHCGWPSFDACEPGTIIERPDHSLGRVRTEILCANCGGHLGHVFDDGPTATGLRYCVNSLSIDFTPEG
jgi:peptide-methionine (R)-S-oxide reductase